MASPESVPQSKPDNIREEVWRVFSELRQRDPSYETDLANKLWYELSPHERDAKQIFVKSLLPNEDLESIARISKAIVIGEYLSDQARLVVELEASYQEPLTPPEPVDAF